MGRALAGRIRTWLRALVRGVSAPSRRGRIWLSALARWRPSPAVVRLALATAGLALGLRLALPVPSAAHRCPPLHEGYLYCALEKVWMPSVLVALAPVVVSQLLGGLALFSLPRLRARWHEGMRPVRMTRRQQRPPYDRDPFLLAASWGVKTGKARGRPGGRAD